MASGKNYYCSKLEAQGFLSLDADLIVHKIILEKQEEIYKTFLPVAEKLNKTEFVKNPVNLLNADNTLNRRELARILFFNSEFLKKQEEIIYPELIIKIKEEISKNPQKNIILNATVLYKIPEILNLCEKIIYVSAPFFKRLIRAKKRDKMPFVQILKRFYSQKNLYSEYKKFNIPIEIVKN